MTPRRRIYANTTERVAAHRARKAKEGAVRLEVTVTTATAERLRAEAKARNCTLGEALEALLEK